MNITNLDELKSFLNENLVDKHGAAKITGQSIRGFEQSVTGKKILPFFEIEGNTRSTIKLYLKSDCKAYKQTMRKVNKQA